jgi:purine-binding chemotaxis protein CheW
VIGEQPQGNSVADTLSIGSGTAAGRASGGKFLTFALGNEEYGVPVLKVREIIKVMDITQVPQVPPHVLGVINLRGKVIPVIDLRRKFGFAATEHTERTCIIVVDVDLATVRVMMGIVVDSVSEVLNVSDSEMEETPDFGGRTTTDYILGLAKVKGAVKILLDLDRVLGSDGQLGRL